MLFGHWCEQNSSEINFLIDQEILGVRALCDGLEEQPFSFSLLLVQVDFLFSKGRLDMAISLAQRAVNVAPSEFRTWIKLAEIYVEMKDYCQALLTLNSCPMFALVERELPKMPVPARAHFPPRPDAILAYGLSEDLDRQEDPNSALARLPGNFLRGTFLRAYKLLTLIALKVGWDELLRFRSSSFVMEEEYRMQKFRDDKPIRARHLSPVPSSNEPIISKDTREHSPVSDHHDALVNGSPSIIVTEEGSTRDPHDLSEEASKVPIQDEDEVLETRMTEVSLKELPALPVGNLVPTPTGSRPGTPSSSNFQRKRLCERWLDNLFMVLYEDLRTFASWREEMSAGRLQGLSFRYTGARWEALGDLCLRLHRRNEAREAYANCVQTKFSPQAWAYLLEVSTLENDLQKTMSSLIRMAMYFEKIYSSCQIPSHAMRSIKHLIQTHGLAKVQNLLLSLDLNHEVVKVIDRYIALAKSFNMKGTLES
ncbi:bud site selection protein [Entomophthora muscae]|uniref:Bud site selection protein n=1 Tax=Entomophthora muscae TaxID=34485 RepID=A0ACC2TEC8_9FUNG|nr:bud site selection protein [Entomophthora muscae]